MRDGDAAPTAPASAASNDTRLRSRAWNCAAAVVDPEIPVLTVADLGILRDVRVEAGAVEVFITPTYSGCPAMDMIAVEIGRALEKAGILGAKITQVLSPAWTTDWISQEGKEKLRQFGIAPPQKSGGRRALFGTEQVTCPHCGAPDTARISEFGSTPCKALYRCTACGEPFDYFKCT